MMKTKSQKPVAFILHSKAAETLAEVIIALTILAVTSTAIVKMVVMGVFATSEGEERLMAYNLAREGVELVGNFRDTNWIRFPGNHEQCWDTLNATDENNCEGSTKLTGSGTSKGRYTIGLELEDTEALLSLGIGEEDQIDGNEDDLLYEVSAENRILYAHLDTGSSLLENSKATIYHRFIQIDEKDAPSECADENIICVSSTVIWEVRGQEKRIAFRSRIKNE